MGVKGLALDYLPCCMGKFAVTVTFRFNRRRAETQEQMCCAKL